MKTDVALSILDNVYVAATAPEAWPTALEQLGRYFDCSCVSLVKKDVRTAQGTAFQWGVSPSDASEYLTYWLPRNIFHSRTRVWRPGHIETDRTILPKRELLRSDYYNGFLKPHEMHAMMRVALHLDDRSLHILALARSEQAGEYEQADIDELRPLVGHLQRAAAIARHTSGVSEALQGLSGLLEQGTTGILLLSASGRVVFANDAARDIVSAEPAIELREARLAARESQGNAVLQRLIAGATGQMREVGDARGGAFRLAASAQPGLTVVVGPLANKDFTSEESPAAFVLLTDPDRGASRPAWMLQNLYGLTAAEIAMAERILKGDTPEQAAVALSVKVSTARFHLRSLFRKTDTRRQSELVRVLLSLPNI